MHIATISAVLNAAPEQVWAVIGDFGGLKRWSAAVNSCTTEGQGIGSHRLVQIGDALIRERLEEWDATTYLLRYRPVSGSVMPVRDMVVSMQLEPIAPGHTQLHWRVEGEPTKPLETVVSILQSRYSKRIDELRTCLAAAHGSKGCGQEANEAGA